MLLATRPSPAIIVIIIKNLLFFENCNAIKKKVVNKNTLLAFTRYRKLKLCPNKSKTRESRSLVKSIITKQESRYVKFLTWKSFFHFENAKTPKYTKRCRVSPTMNSIGTSLAKAILPQIK